MALFLDENRFVPNWEDSKVEVLNSNSSSSELISESINRGDPIFKAFTAGFITASKCINFQDLKHEFHLKNPEALGPLKSLLALKILKVHNNYSLAPCFMAAFSSNKEEMVI